jgi:hypothetical protein
MQYPPRKPVGVPLGSTSRMQRPPQQPTSFVHGWPFDAPITVEPSHEPVHALQVNIAGQVGTPGGGIDAKQLGVHTISIGSVAEAGAHAAPYASQL